MSPLVIQNENSKEKESLLNSKFSQRKLPKIDKQKTSEKYKEREREKEKEKINNNKLRKIEEKKNDYKNNNNSNDLQHQLRSKEEPIKKIKIISKIEDDLYERLLNKQKIKRISSSESPKVRANSFENNHLTLEKKNSLELEDIEKTKKAVKKRKFLLPSLVKEIKLQY